MASIFSSRDDDLWNDAYLDTWHRDWMTHALAFRDVADFVVDAVNDQTLSADAVVFPVAFCYRHYLELMLKGLRIEASRLLGLTRPTVKSLLEHDLVKLWRPLRRLLEQIDPGESAQYDGVEKRIMDVNHIDPTGQSWKYPFDTQEKRTLSGVGPFSLPKLKELVGDLGKFLDGTYDYIGSIRDEG